MFIISANYRDPESVNLYLIRDSQEEPSKAKEVLSVLAKVVAFVATRNEEEISFGCWLVAKAESVKIDADGSMGIRPGETKLAFKKDRFNDQKDVEVEGCDLLRLTPDGSAYATGPKTEDTEPVAQIKAEPEVKAELKAKPKKKLPNSKRNFNAPN